MAQQIFGPEASNILLNPNIGNLGKTQINPTLTPVRVKSILLDETHPRFKELGGWNALGLIEYDSVINPQQTTTSGGYSVAYPLNPNLKNYPLINEIVFIVNLPNTSIGTSSSSTQSYYMGVTSVWNHPHQNAYPSNSNEPAPPQQKTYVETQAGSVVTPQNNPTQVFLGATFKERGNIHPLLPFEGDVIQEGRWGNSIRFGSTVKKTPNNWSAVGTDGDPIIILRNGQSVNATTEGWIPITEDINNDLVSIYATSTQQIPLNASSTSYVSYKDNKPITPNQYSGNQLILNSGRLVFNSTKDHILLSSKQSINLNAITSVNIDAPETIIQSNIVYLGSKNATQPVLLGNATVELLSKLLTNLNTFMDFASKTMSSAPGSALVPLNTAAASMVTTLNDLQANLEDIKSKYVKTA